MCPEEIVMLEDTQEVPKTPAIKLISSYYSESYPLQTFLVKISNGIRIVNSEDEDSYRNLVEGAWVGVERVFERRVFETTQAPESQSDVSLSYIWQKMKIPSPSRSLIGLKEQLPIEHTLKTSLYNPRI